MRPAKPHSRATVASPRPRARRRSRGRCAAHHPPGSATACRTDCSVASCANTALDRVPQRRRLGQAAPKLQRTPALQLLGSPRLGPRRQFLEHRIARARGGQAQQMRKLLLDELGRLRRSPCAAAASPARDPRSRSAIWARSTAARGNGAASLRASRSSRRAPSVSPRSMAEAASSHR